MATSRINAIKKEISELRIQRNRCAEKNLSSAVKGCNQAIKQLIEELTSLTASKA